MIETNVHWQDGICDTCGWPRMHEVALEFVEPGNMGEDGSWVGGYTPEKADKWRKALKSADEKLTTRCLQLSTPDGDSGSVCKKCLEKWIKEDDEHQVAKTGE